MQRFTPLLTGLLLGALVLAVSAAGETGAFAGYPIPTPGSQPVSIVAGPDGALWFTEFAGNKIGRVTTDGAFSEYVIPTGNARPDDMTVGPDGNFWFAETAGNKIGRISVDGRVEEFGVGIPPAARPTAITPGPDGNLWFTERGLTTPNALPGQIGRITTTGEVTNYPIPSNGHPVTIAAGADGALWFTESPGNRIGRIDPYTGVVTEKTVPTFQSAPWELTSGPDGALWFTEINANKIGRITTDGDISEFPIPTPASQPNTIRPGPDPNPADDCAYQRDALGQEAFAERYGNFGGCVYRLATSKTLWFTEQNANRVAQITTDGDIFEFAVPTAQSAPGGLTEGPDGAVWFAEFTGNQIGRLDVKRVGRPTAPGAPDSEQPPEALQFSSATAARTRVIPVHSTIQSAVDSAKPGDVVLVPRGTYHESVAVSTDGISIVGLPGAVLDGAGVAGQVGIRVAPAATAETLHGFGLQGLRIEGYARDGLLLRHVDGFSIIGNLFVDNDDYGVFPVLSSHGLIASNQASGSEDTGIYVGQSTDVTVDANTAEQNTVGFDIENSTRITAALNQARRNSLGLIVQGAPGLTVPNASDVLVSGNRIEANNRPNPSTDPTDLLSRLPAGTGLLTIDADRVTITHNVVTGNASAGIALISLPAELAALDPRVDPVPDDEHVTANTALGNGASPDPRLAPFPPADLLWDGTGAGNCWTRNVFETAFPTPLPACRG
jgi:virginiamycin B lyase